MTKRLSTMVAILAISATLQVSSASVAKDNVRLTVYNQTTGKVFTFTDAELAAMPQSTIKTETIWTEGQQKFSGPSLNVVLDVTDWNGGDLKITALNDYSVNYSANLVEAEVPILAIRQNNKTISVREKGPIWLMFPFGEAEYRREELFALSVWQINRLDIIGD